MVFWGIKVVMIPLFVVAIIDATQVTDKVA